MTQMDKEYIEKEYEQAIKEYNAALTEDDLDTARRTMKRLEAIAMQDYGFDYADELAMKKEDCKKFFCNIYGIRFQMYYKMRILQSCPPTKYMIY